LDKLTTYGSNLGINEHSNKNVSTIKETMACQAEVHVPDCLRLVVDNKGDRGKNYIDFHFLIILSIMRLQLGKNEKKLILIIAEYKNYLTCIEGFPNTYLMLAESKNPNHELHVRAKAA
ncbi:unnamed protein product, partial [Brassica oleracea var. botrytis]